MDARIETKPASAVLASGCRLLTAAEAAALLNVPASWVRKHGEALPGFVRLGKYVRWDAARLEAFIDAGGIA